MKNLFFLVLALTLILACGDDAPDIVTPPPAADFESDMTLVVEGTRVQFSDNSTGSPTEWEWTFQGGSPATSSDREPKVTYAAVGEYSVALIVRNSGGEDSHSKTALIKVIPDFSEDLIAHYEYDATMILDASGNSLHAEATNILTGDAWHWFDGTAFARVAHDPLFNVEEFTLTIVMNQHFGDPKPKRYMFSKANSFSVGMNPDNTIFMEVSLENDNVYNLKTTETVATSNFGDDVFNFLSFTYRAGEIHIGKDLTYASNTSIPSDPILTNTNDVYMGAKEGLSGFYVGAFQDIRLYDRVLSEEEMNSLYQFEYASEPHPQ